MSVSVTLNWVRVIPTQTFRVDYKKSADITWTLVGNNIDNTTIDIPDLENDTEYDFRIMSNCAGGGGSTTVIITETTPVACSVPTIIEIGIIPPCPVGWTLLPDESACQRVETQEAVFDGPEPPYSACHYTDSAYAKRGAAFFQVDGYNVNGTYVTGMPPTVFTGNTLWANVSSNLTDGRLNVCGIWDCANQSLVDVELGFTRTIDIPETKIYYIGLGMDNVGAIKINGEYIINQDPYAMEVQFPSTPGAIYPQCPYEFWMVYPVLLTAGLNLIEITGLNPDVAIPINPGIMGAEIYDATEAELIACDTEPELDVYIIFSTKSYFGEEFQIGNWTCSDPSFSLVYNSGTGTYSCQKIFNIPPN